MSPQANQNLSKQPPQQQTSSSNTLNEQRKEKAEKRRKSSAIIYQTAVSGGRTANVASANSNPYSTNVKQPAGSFNMTFDSQLHNQSRHVKANSSEQPSQVRASHVQVLSTNITNNQPGQHFNSNEMVKVNAPQPQGIKTVKKANITSSTDNNIISASSGKSKITKQTPTGKPNCSQQATVSGSVDLT